MNQTHETSNNTNKTANDHWGIRGNYWIKQLNPVPQYKARKRRVIHRPLVLSGHGIKLNVNSGTLVIQCGFTHYPQNKEQYRFFPSDRQLPSRIVILDGDGSVTLSALEWLSEQGVPLVQINWRGEVSSIGGAAYAANADLIKRQHQMQDNGQGFEFSKGLILEKMNNAYKTIKHISDGSAEAKAILKKLKEHSVDLKNNPPNNFSSLLTLEGIAAATYFRYWYTLPLKWRGLGRKPIPQEWRQVGTRIGSGRKSNQHAIHPVNAILNYAYGILENQIRGYVLAACVDPTIGYMHSSTNSNAALVFDLMEPVRPIIDKKLLEFVLGRTFSPDDFILNKKGICRLHPQFARYIVKLAQDIPEIEKITTKNLNKLFRK